MQIWGVVIYDSIYIRIMNSKIVWLYQKVKVGRQTRNSVLEPDS